MKLSALWPAVLALSLSACASYAPRGLEVGQTADDVLRRMGPPTGSYPLADGGRQLEFARGPYGHHTYMVELDAQGRVTGWRQTLTEANYARVVPGLSRHDLLLLLGRPAETQQMPRQHVQVWNYPATTGDCLWFQVALTEDGRVKGTMRATDWRCNGDDSRS